LRRTPSPSRLGRTISGDRWRFKCRLSNRPCHDAASPGVATRRGRFQSGSRALSSSVIRPSAIVVFVQQNRKLPAAAGVERPRAGGPTGNSPNRKVRERCEFEFQRSGGPAPPHGREDLSILRQCAGPSDLPMIGGIAVRDLTITATAFRPCRACVMRCPKNPSQNRRGPSPFLRGHHRQMVGGAKTGTVPLSQAVL
jgi:hypothetical protein